MLKRLLFILTALIIGISQTPAANYEPDEMINISVYEKINPAIVAIEANLPDGFSAGTGCIVREDGLILTGSHVVEDSNDIDITTYNGHTYKGKIVSIMGKNNDLALLKIEAKGKLKTIEFGDSEKVKVGQKVLAIGNPFGFSGTLTQGIVSRIDYAKNNGFNTLILDTAGRLQIDTDMMAELLLIDRIFNPQEKLLVIDAMTGQETVNVAETFDSQLSITGLVLTKLDGDSRGGAALSVAYCTGKPIKLTGTGEKLHALEDFYPERMATRILGMGDIVSLVERAQEVFDEKEARELEKKMEKAEFSFNDFVKIQKQMKMLGSIDQILGMIPGMNISKDDKEKISHEGEKQFKKIEVLINSMTPQERNHPELLNSSRKRRIAAGSGISLHELNLFINQFEQMRQMMKGMSDMKKSLGKFKGMNPALGMKKMMQTMRKFR